MRENQIPLRAFFSFLDNNIYYVWKASNSKKQSIFPTRPIMLYISFLSWCPVLYEKSNWVGSLLNVIDLKMN